MTYVPDLDGSRPPPRQRRFSRRMASIVGAVIIAVLVAGGIYYVFNVNQVPTAAGITTGQGGVR